MKEKISDDGKSATTSTLHSCSQYVPGKDKMRSYASVRNVFQFLASREINRAKRVPRSFEAKSLPESKTDCVGVKYREVNVNRALISWVESESLKHLSAKYCPLLPPPRSTIAAAFSSDFKILASTHGDHTVKIIDCLTGHCLKVLSGHRRTPWVVRFHPVYPEILASGSLDHEVRLWDANTAYCIGFRDFYRPIASIAFHAHGHLLAVASGHKLYIWNYNRRESNPSVVLKTRRSLRAVHFHPHAAPFILTAEVNNLDSTDTALTLATTTGYLCYDPPAVFFTNIQSTSYMHGEGNTPFISPGPLSMKNHRETVWQNPHHETESVAIERPEFSFTDQRQAHLYSDNQHGIEITSMESQQHDIEITRMERQPSGTSNSLHLPDGEMGNSILMDGAGPIDSGSFTVMNTVEATEEQAGDTVQRSSRNFHPTTAPSPFEIREMTHQLPIRPDGTPHNFSGSIRSLDSQMLLRNVDNMQNCQILPSGDQPGWELPFLQGWLMGQTHAGLNAIFPSNDSLLENPSMVQGIISDALRSGLQPARGSIIHRHSYSHVLTPSASAEGMVHMDVQNDDLVRQSAHFNIASELAASVSSDSSTELPCTVKLRIWPYDVQRPSALLDPSTCRLTIPHAVLCSEMGAHFSPCGRFLAACVACILPHVELDPGSNSQSHHDAMETGTSPTRHPISGHRFIYELRVYSLEEATFGLVLVSRAIRAAHCLTSIQFSPTSEHILVAYGRRHSSLLKSFVTDGETRVHIYTILEVYRVSDMELVRVLPSAEDEVNVACFHPSPGYGLVYGTKEGRLRILQFLSQSEISSTRQNRRDSEFQTNAPE